MNSDIITGKWKQWKGQVWLLWAECFDSDSAWLMGNNDWFSGMLQENYGKAQQPTSEQEKH